MPSWRLTTKGLLIRITKLPVSPDAHYLTIFDMETTWPIEAPAANPSARSSAQSLDNEFQIIVRSMVPFRAIFGDQSHSSQAPEPFHDFNQLLT